MLEGTIKPIALSHFFQEFLSLVISRRCHSALYWRSQRNFLPEVSPGALSLACKSIVSTLSAGHPRHCEREDHQTLALFYSELDSSLSSNGTWHPSGGPWQQLHCTACESYFLETHGTPLHGKRVPTELLVWAVGALAEGLGIRAVARVFEA